MCRQRRRLVGLGSRSRGRGGGLGGRGLKKLVAVGMGGEMGLVDSPDVANILDYKDRPLRVCPRRLDGHDVVFGREDALSIEDLLDCGIRPVKKQTTGVDGPLEVGVKDEAEFLDGEIGYICHVDCQMRNKTCGWFIETVRSGCDAACRGRVCGTPSVISHNTGDVGRIGVHGARADPSAAEPVVAWRRVGFDYHVVALAYGDLHVVGGVWIDGDQVGADDGQAVAVDAELELSVDGYVDEADEVLPSSLEHYFVLGTAANAEGIVGLLGCAIPSVGAVDQARLQCRRGTLFGRVPEAEGLSM